MSTSFETPSKRTAASLEKMALSSPSKATTVASTSKSATMTPLEKFIAENSAPEAEEEVEEPVEDYRRRFVGDVDLEEKDEPLLKASSRRFVLFPIQYHEVSLLPTRPLVVEPPFATRFVFDSMFLTRVSPLPNASRT